MLVLTRREEETVIIDDGRIRITVLIAGGGFVRLGIEAPDDVEINRGELQARLDIERHLAQRS